MKIYRSLFIGLSVLLCSFSLWADSTPTVNATLSPGKCLRGDLLTLQIQVTLSSSMTVEVPQFPARVGEFEIRQSTTLPSQFIDGQTVERFQAELQNFTTGQQTLSGLQLPYRDSQGEKHVLVAPPVQVVVEEVPAGPQDKGDIRGIKGVIGPVAASPLWWLLAALLMVAAGVYFWNRRQRKILGPPPPPPVPADEAALTALTQLRGSGWLEAGKLKEFYSGLSEILRTYLEEGFKVPALERTTGELIRDLRKRSEWPSESLVELQTLLEDCDLVKFAKFRPEAAQGLQDHAVAVRLVEKTKTAIRSEAIER